MLLLILSVSAGVSFEGDFPCEYPKVCQIDSIACSSSNSM